MDRLYEFFVNDKSRVIGNINEVDGFVQGTKLTSPRVVDIPCPFAMFKELKKCENQNQSGSSRSTCDVNPCVSVDGTEKSSVGQIPDNKFTTLCSTHIALKNNSLILAFLLQLDPLVSLLHEEDVVKKLQAFKSDLSMNLANHNNFFKKMGFSRKKGTCLQHMQDELIADVTDDKLSLETLQYICKILNKDLVILDFGKLLHRRISSGNCNVLEILVIKMPTANSVLYRFEKIHDDKDMEIESTSDRMKTMEANIQRYIGTNVINEYNVRDIPGWMNKMRFTELLKLYKFVCGPNALARKKEDVINTLTTLFVSNPSTA